MIRIQNIYYMLAYAFQILREQGYASCGTEQFENTADLLSLKQKYQGKVCLFR